MHGLHFKQGKLVARESTEEEKAEAEASKAQVKAKAPPAKGAKPEEVDPAAIEQRKKAIAEREAENQRNQHLWNELSEERKFYRICEDQFREPSVRY